ncbi:uncharacterized protein FOMMEDRAFT_139768 [Fomitiporia mediterranea MF3/22]|uniref:uncharacterized protein n=1 Tax=Fomitiporia mediterranea (strain MF3/22) TaxID=694068 RepID=UPI0004409B34|nr:uncharacterized protein FOMMEDRAFT_139768 [Fomitiporia mediterranea MF3/22]EJD03504.1 hypothetical protein FOMMEDRAFT_139768 [Fomitiporia mediterranea MF3/22]
MGDWINLMIYESVLVVLLLIKGFQMYKELGETSLYLALFKDGAVFYALLYALSVANVIVIGSPFREPSKFAYLASMERVMHSVLTGRLLFTLQKASAERITTGTSIDLPTLQFSGSTGVPSTMDSRAESGSETLTPSLVAGELEEQPNQTTFH